MRTRRDRIRHAISFEILGLALVVPLGAAGFGMPATDLGVVAVFAASMATVWNYLYNIWFDRAMKRLRGSVHKTYGLRVVHAVLFECGLLIATLPFFAWYLGIGLWQAFLMDFSFVAFYLVYAFLFNLTYDRVFPLPKDA
ncbi:PACE efflux transporter [Lutimaribacter sp. EGI FJ00015]|uniref:PACE efflux transporter n=1 Tax=Lutimaribacter degradans TaxID=2945989 RepID=A0ACC5ZWX6_9RHOB|nr:PACE efflux transporter [Lutimaribacter sp. EGI FJ00013]MCM2562678.1 PACE efflux transporter [Lutimaribacter sp. EGI FJ00013]MCO0613835.1 PACE efflux transporter [Lutimaribacter sp. EGI FJ00015]MCO0636682.1 PACE efflux transporter [Lutimaribacter sp. EGI FJ00014]